MTDDQIMTLWHRRIDHEQSLRDAVIYFARDLLARTPSQTSIQPPPVGPQDVMWEVYAYARIMDGFDSLEGVARDIRRKEANEQAQKIRLMLQGDDAAIARRAVDGLRGLYGLLQLLKPEGEWQENHRAVEARAVIAWYAETHANESPVLVAAPSVELQDDLSQRPEVVVFGTLTTARLRELAYHIQPWPSQALRHSADRIEALQAVVDELVASRESTMTLAGEARYEAAWEAARRLAKAPQNG